MGYFLLNGLLGNLINPFYILLLLIGGKIRNAGSKSK
jgi:hypothetical protein